MPIRALVAAGLAVLLAIAAPARAAVTLQTDDQKTIYAIGQAMARQLEQFQFTPDEVSVLIAGMQDALTHAKSQVDVDAQSKQIRAFAEKRQAAAVEKEKAATGPFLEKAAAAPGAKKTASGLIYKELTPGTGPQPKETDKVKVNYKGTLTDGTEFDSSYKRNEPATFPLKGVIKCWTEGLQLMKVGGKSQLICPSDIAYGNSGRPPLIKPGAPLVFEVELLEIVQ
jgi:FKBP-type peptidyl-prolyl cis-trans isomerase FkpA